MLTIFALAFPTQAALLKDNGTRLTISGKGMVKAASDVAYITVGVERTEKTATEAQGIAAEKMSNIQGSLKKMGIKDDKIETTRVTLQPTYQYDKGKRTLIGYTASNQIKVTIDKLDDVGKIIDNSISAGDIPRSSPKTYSLCSPSSGAGRQMLAGVWLNFQWGATTTRLPMTGCSTS